MSVFLLLMVIITFIYFFTHNKQYKNDNLFLILSFILLFGLAAIRAESTGYDLPVYKMYYKTFTPLPLADQFKMKYFEYGYLVYSYIIYKITGGDFRSLMVITSFISYYGIFKFFKEYSSNKLLSIILYICIGYYIAPFSGLRQCIAISIICLNYKNIVNRNFRRFLFFVFLAFLFHKSALIFVFSYFLYNCQIDKKKVMLFLSAMLLIYVFRYKFVLFFELFYSNYDVESNAGEGYKLLLFYVAIFMLITMFKKKYVNNNMINNMMYNFLCFGILIQIFATVEGNAHRAGKYYLITLCCMLPNLVNIFSKNSKKEIIYAMIFILSIIFFIGTNSGLTYDTFL